MDPMSVMCVLCSNNPDLDSMVPALGWLDVSDFLRELHPLALDPAKAKIHNVSSRLSMSIHPSIH
jgi:hypothetical protein